MILWSKFKTLKTYKLLIKPKSSSISDFEQVISVEEKKLIVLLQNSGATSLTLARTLASLVLTRVLQPCHIFFEPRRELPSTIF